MEIACLSIESTKRELDWCWCMWREYVDRRPTMMMMNSARCSTSTFNWDTRRLLPNYIYFCIHDRVWVVPILRHSVELWAISSARLIHISSSNQWYLIDLCLLSLCIAFIRLLQSFACRNHFRLLFVQFVCIYTMYFTNKCNDHIPNFLSTANCRRFAASTNAGRTTRVQSI